MSGILITSSGSIEAIKAYYDLNANGDAKRAQALLVQFEDLGKQMKKNGTVLYVLGVPLILALGMGLFVMGMGWFMRSKGNGVQKRAAQAYQLWMVENKV
jgi:hypothetical protein